MALSWRKPPPTQAEEDELFLLRLEDDTEEAPWMVMGTPQFWSASSFAHCLHSYALAHDLPWFVASMLPIRYRGGSNARGSSLRTVLSPSCPTTAELVRPGGRGSFPPFVLEVVSPESVQRDEHKKRGLRPARRQGVRAVYAARGRCLDPGRLSSPTRPGCSRPGRLRRTAACGARCSGCGWWWRARCCWRRRRKASTCSRRNRKPRHARRRRGDTTAG